MASAYLYTYLKRWLQVRQHELALEFSIINNHDLSFHSFPRSTMPIQQFLSFDPNYTYVHTYIYLHKKNAQDLSAYWTS
jgi:hypothetical protein